MKHFCESLLLVTALLAGVGCQPGDADRVEANKEVMRSAYAALDAQDFDRLGELMADDFEFKFVGEPELLDRATTFDVVRSFYTAFPDYRHHIHEMLAEGDRVAVRLSFQGTHEADFQGIPATGNRIDYEGAHMATVVEGKITELWVLEDNLGYLTQLGMVLMPDSAAGAPAG